MAHTWVVILKGTEELDLLSVVGWSAAAWWAGATLVWLASVRGTPALSHRPAPAGRAAPTVSVVVAARNEPDRVGDTVRRFLAQRAVDLELILVDDRSTDATSEILSELSRNEPRLRVIRVDSLPDDWLGKPHACDLGAAEAHGDWLLFADADSWPDPDLVSDAVCEALAERADHLCVLPDEERVSAWGRGAWLTFYLFSLPVLALVNRDRIHAPVGVGAFNLVRAKAYRAIGGHRALRYEVIDDAKLGLLLQRAGYRTRARAGQRRLKVDWAGGLASVLHALEKNLFAAFRYRLALALPAALVPLIFWSAAISGPLHGTAAGWAATASLFAVTLPAWWVARRVGAGALEAFLACLCMPTLPIALLRSIWLTLWRGGVLWRGTLYPLERLRRGLVR